MKFPDTRKYPLFVQCVISFILVLIVSIGCFYTSDYTGYKVVALLLLMTVSILAMLFEILPVLLAAVFSAIIWNFFFIPPIYTFHIDNAEDLLMFSMYFLVAFVNIVLTVKIREAEKKARDKEEKENTIKLYNTLLNSLSHELRTPISTIIGAVDTLKEQNEKLTKENQDVLLHEIDVASIRLNRQVENLLNMSRLESGTLKPRYDWCDISELINLEINKAVPLTKHTIINSSDENLPLFKIDSGLMEQVLHNLIHNAIQYTDECTRIEIKAKHNNEALVLFIKDEGKGFTEEEKAKVFGKFYRMPNTKTGGSGLGLSIVKGFVEALNGTIEILSDPKGGATFRIEIPAETSYLNQLKNE